MCDDETREALRGGSLGDRSIILTRQITLTETGMGVVKLIDEVKGQASRINIVGNYRLMGKLDAYTAVLKQLREESEKLKPCLDLIPGSN